LSDPAAVNPAASEFNNSCADSVVADLPAANELDKRQPWEELYDGFQDLLLDEVQERQEPDALIGNCDDGKIPIFTKNNKFKGH
jgi:hypothetical protein